jgi:hypothetical protein
MVWEVSRVEHFLDITRISRDKRESSRTLPYVQAPKGTKTMFPLEIDDSAEIRIQPYNLEHLQNALTNDRSPGTVYNLLARIKQGNEVVGLGYEIMDRQITGFSRLLYFGFKNNMPGGFMNGSYSGPEWLNERPGIIDANLMPYFMGLKSFRPAAADSIETCVKLLEAPGQGYGA